MIRVWPVGIRITVTDIATPRRIEPRRGPAASNVTTQAADGLNPPACYGDDPAAAAGVSGSGNDKRRRSRLGRPLSRQPLQTPESDPLGLCRDVCELAPMLPLS